MGNVERWVAIPDIAVMLRDSAPPRLTEIHEAMGEMTDGVKQRLNPLMNHANSWVSRRCGLSAIHVTSCDASTLKCVKSALQSLRFLLYGSCVNGG